jgi:hypothetical protein
MPCKVEGLLVVVDQIDFVHCDDYVTYSEQGADQGVATRLGQHVLAGINQNDRQVGPGSSGCHVSRELVPRGISNDE